MDTYTFTEEEEREAREAKAEYYRDWRKKNPEKVKASNKKYWIKYAARLRAEREAALNV